MSIWDKIGIRTKKAPKPSKPKKLKFWKLIRELEKPERN